MCSPYFYVIRRAIKNLIDVNSEFGFEGIEITVVIWPTGSVIYTTLINIKLDFQVEVNLITTVLIKKTTSVE